MDTIKVSKKKQTVSTSCLPFILQILMSFLFDSHVLFCTEKETQIMSSLSDTCISLQT